MTQTEFQKIASSIPATPGIYKYYNQQNELIYVGKAKHLRKRVSSYFNKGFTNYKTHELVKNIHHIEFTIVHSEADAFLLENSLIKEHQPRYNINLKDDKTYPFIIIKNEPFPRIFLTRKKIKDGSEYLGPFTSVGKVRELLEFIKQIIPLRNCTLNLTDKNIQKKKFKVCLEYHLGNCKGPCEGFQTAEEYAQSILQVKDLLKGNLKPVIQFFTKQMQEASVQLHFEKAEVIRKKIDYLKQYQSKSAIVNQKLGNVDVFSFLNEEQTAYVNYLMIQNGTIVQTHTIAVEKKLDEPADEILAMAIAQLRQTFNSNANEIIVPFKINYPEREVNITVPKAGDKMKLLELSKTNVNYFRDESLRKKHLHIGEARNSNLLNQVKNDLKLTELPFHIECFDNSNLHGTNPVSAMVCFKNGQPSKNDYRRFNVKTVKGIDDFATMKEIVFRRYSRLINENKELPQLIIIDGGKGQLSAAMESINQLQLTGKITVIGLAKNKEEIFFPGDQQSLILPFDSESLKFIRRIRDEVHRFGITFHRMQRSKSTFINPFEEVKGIGKSTADTLLKKYKSIKNIFLSPSKELEDLIGKHKAKLVLEYFKNEK